MNHYLSILHPVRIAVTKPRICQPAGMKPSWVKTMYLYDADGGVTQIEIHAHEEADLAFEEDTR